MTIKVVGSSPSSDGEHEYAIYKNTKTGAISCSCIGYHHRHTCRHITSKFLNLVRADGNDFGELYRIKKVE